MTLRDDTQIRTCLRDISLPIPCFAERLDLDEEERWLGCREIQKGRGPGNCEHYAEEGKVSKTIITAGSGPRLKVARKAKGWSQLTASIETDLNPASISHHETGKTVPRTRTIRTYAETYGVSEEWLRTGLGDGPKAGKTEAENGQKAQKSGQTAPKPADPVKSPGTKNKGKDRTLTLNLTGAQYKQLQAAAARSWLPIEKYALVRLAEAVEGMR